MLHEINSKKSVNVSYESQISDDIVKSNLSIMHVSLEIPSKYLIHTKKKS